MKEKKLKKQLLSAIAHSCREAMTVLSCGIGVISLVCAALIYKIYPAVSADPIGAVAYYGPMFEYIMMTLLIVVVGAIIFDIMDKKWQR